MHRVPLYLAAGALAFLSGCGSSGSKDASPQPAGKIMASCLAQIDHDGESFIGNAVGVEPVRGRSLGEGTIPACGDVAAENAVPEQAATILAIEDVPPDVAFVQEGQEGTVYIRRDLATPDFPAALRRLLKPPTCQSADDPIELSGPWRGVSEPDPPYDVLLYVDRTSDQRYARAYLSVRVPASLALPQSAFDALQSDAGASVDITAHCDGEAFVADRIAAAKT